MRIAAHLLLLLCLNVVASVPLSGSEISGGDEVVAVAAGREFTQEDLEKRIGALPDGYREAFQSQEGRARLAREMVRIEVFSQEALKLGLDNDPGLQSRLSELTKAVLAAEYARVKISTRVSISEAEASAYYEENPEEYGQPERICAPKIFVRVSDNDSFETVSEKRGKAERARELLVEGADFKKTAWEFSDEQPDTEPDYFAHGRLVPEIEPTVFELKKGDTSPVLRVRDGFVVFRMEDRIPAGIRPFYEVKAEIVQKLREEKLQKEFEAAERELFEKYQVVFSPGMGPVYESPKEQSIATGKISRVVLAQSDAVAEGVIATLLIDGTSSAGGNIEKIAITLRADTPIARQADEKELPARLEDLRAGQFVRALCAGPVRLSSPPQADAYRIVILERPD